MGKAPAKLPSPETQAERAVLKSISPKHLDDDIPPPNHKRYDEENRVVHSEFLQAVFRYLQAQPRTARRTVMLVDCEVEGEVYLDGFDLPCSLKIEGGTFDDDFEIANCSFDSLAIQDVVLNGYLRVQRCALGGEASLTNLKLPKTKKGDLDSGIVFFQDNQISGETTIKFRDPLVEDEVQFNRNHFKDNVQIKLSNAASATFSYCTFDLSLDGDTSGTNTSLILNRSEIGDETHLQTALGAAFRPNGTKFAELNVDSPDEVEDPGPGETGPILNFNGCNIERPTELEVGPKTDLIINSTTTKGVFEIGSSSFAHLRVTGSSFQKLVIRDCSLEDVKKARFMDNSIGWLQFSKGETEGPEAGDDLSYGREFIASFAEGATDLNSHLQASLISEGRTESANDIYIDEKLSETNSKSQSTWGRYFGKFLYYTCGYGKKPLQSLGLLSVVWVIGCVLLPLGGTTLTKPSDPAPKFNRWVYSLDTLMPFLDLEMSKYYRPLKPAGQFYERFCTILGWLLIPLAIAAFTNLGK